MDNKEDYIIFCDDTKLSGIFQPAQESEREWAEVKDKIVKECCLFLQNNN